MDGIIQLPDGKLLDVEADRERQRAMRQTRQIAAPNAGVPLGQLLDKFKLQATAAQPWPVITEKPGEG